LVSFVERRPTQMNKHKLLTLTVILVVTLSMVGLTTNAVARSRSIASSPPLGAASSFSVLAALSMSAAEAGTTVSGDLGLSPGVEVSKTGPWTVGGSQYFGPSSLAFDAQGAALGAFNNLAGQTSDGVWASTNPVPGVWTIAEDQTFTGTLTLTGGYDDVWVFQIGRDLTFSGAVVLGGNAQACHVFWQIGGDATIAVGSSYIGTLIASGDITLVSGANVNGRIISLNSSLTTDGNTISGPTCLSAPVPTATQGTTTTGATATLLPGVSGLPSTGGAPIQNETFPWGMMIVGGFSIMVLSLGIRALRRTHNLK
jgi:hypothetical protein